MNGSTLANRSAVDRNTTDYYRTPPDVTLALLNFLEEQERMSPTSDCVIWEPACGTGEMVEAMRGKGYEVFCSDLYPTGYGVDNTPVDFLEVEPADFSTGLSQTRLFPRRKSSYGGRWSWKSLVLSSSNRSFGTHKGASHCSGNTLRRMCCL